MWFVYIVRCADNSLYTGITTDITRRIHQHNNAKGSKYTRIRIPVHLVYSEQVKTKGFALKREFEIKKLTHAQKLQLI